MSSVNKLVVENFQLFNILFDLIMQNTASNTRINKYTEVRPPWREPRFNLFFPNVLFP